MREERDQANIMTGKRGRNDIRDEELMKKSSGTVEFR